MTISPASLIKGILDHRRNSGWRDLLRIPNLFTVPGDVLAGAALAGITIGDLWLIIPGILVSLSLYTAGLFLNDYCDRDKDAKERPERPLPSGRVRPQKALAAALVLLSLAMLAGPVLGGRSRLLIPVVIPALVVLIVSYNTCARRLPWTGFLTMGMCRGANLLLGAALCTQYFTPVIWTAAAAETLYIASVTAAAHREADKRPVPSIKWFPLAGAAAALPAFLVAARPSVTGILPACAFLGRVAYISAKKKYGPGMIGQFILALILLQAAFAAAVWPGAGPGQIFSWSILIFLAGMYYFSARMAKVQYAS